MVDLYLHYINFLNFAKSCILSYLSQFDNTEKKNGIIEFVFQLQARNANIKGIFSG